MNYVERYYLMNSSILIELIKLYFHRKQNLINLRLTHLSWLITFSYHNVKFCVIFECSKISMQYHTYVNTNRLIRKSVNILLIYIPWESHIWA